MTTITEYEHMHLIYLFLMNTSYQINSMWCSCIPRTKHGYFEWYIVIASTRHPLIHTQEINLSNTNGSLISTFSFLLPVCKCICSFIYLFTQTITHIKMNVHHHPPTNKHIFINLQTGNDVLSLLTTLFYLFFHFVSMRILLWILQQNLWVLFI